MSDLDPAELGAALAQIPLFREMQQLLMSQSRPVNWEIARQIAHAVAGAGGPGPRPLPDEQPAFEDSSRLAEFRLSQATGLESRSPVVEVVVLDRTGWADANLAGLRPLIDRLATRLQSQMQADAVPAIPMNAFLDALGPFLLGVQVGFLIGYLSRRVLGQFDLPFPIDRPGRILYVFPNIAELAGELDVEMRQFRLWLALHEVAHHLEFTGVAWTRDHFRGLVERYVDAAELDPSEIMDRLRSLGDPDRLNRLLERPDELLPMLMTPAQREIVKEIQAFMSVLEGYADWAMDEVGRNLLPELPKLREGMTRRRAERSSSERLLEMLLGLDLKLVQYRSGERFVRAVAGAAQLGALWERAENLPTLDEVAEPTRWLSRVAFS
ncbi:MAG: zinc-dependent metalloprotease [Actinomycetota bacterium]